MAKTLGGDGDPTTTVSVLPLPPGPKRDISLLRQHYLETLLALQRIDPDWREWLEGIPERAARAKAAESRLGER